MPGRGDQCRAIGKTTVEGAHTDARAVGDLLHRYVDAALAEDGLRGRQDLITVAARIGSQLLTSQEVDEFLPFSVA